ncbi:gonadotropin-releasing hormone receptor isoform X3 [Folsomia candida]|uniref:Gonadotropin-releasing hormone receptor n=1 Tax=Folsomia candida TaxID=158441 RepID=A0A226ERS0_FOLCA|nr:gonadotropin-releasing hormone receptor isoform X3 [Folsomia candida]OXA59754.1 Gonadotropin-releasing hormone receptor [Folsomia candida]
MFVGELPTMDEPGGDEGLTFDLDYSFQKMNLSAREITQIYPIEECVELFGNQSNVPAHVGCLEHAPVLTQSTVIKSLILSLMVILSLVGNVGTMVSIKKSKRQRSAHIYTLIYHLSIADLFVTGWCILGDAIWSLTVEWMAGNIECKIFKFFQMFSLYLSTFIMVLIGVDRFISVKYPLKSMRNGLCFKLIAVCWVASAVLSLPQMVIFHVKQGPFVEDFFQCVTYGFYTAPWQEHLYTVFTLICGFLLPLFILVTTYILTVVTLHRNEEILDHTGTFRTLIDPNRRKLLRRAKMKSLRISVAIVASFIICWTPYYAVMMAYLFFVPNKDQIINEDLYSGFFFFGMSNSLFNPLIYGIFHIWTPRRKELQREISSRRTLLTSISFHRQRSSGTLLNGSLLSRNVNAECGQGHSMADGYHSQQHHHHLHRNGTFGTSGISSKDSVRTMSTSFSNKQTKEEFLNRKNSLSEQNNHNVSHTPNLHNDNQATPSAKEPPPETHICICNKKGITSPNAIENHV